jgi:hypothetical protein
VKFEGKRKESMILRSDATRRVKSLRDNELTNFDKDLILLGLKNPVI